jgi:serine protease Do
LVVTVGAQRTADPRHGRGPLRELAEALEQLTRDVSPSVVQIVATGYGPVEDRNATDTGLVVGPQRRMGSGAVVDPAGYIVTSAHVVAGARHVRVLMPRQPPEARARGLVAEAGDIVEAQVIGTAAEIDLALLKIEGTGLPALHLSGARMIRQGELVFAFGSPEGLFNSVTMGVVSAVARQPNPDSQSVFIQTDAAINPGSSGGPLVNVDGELVGLNTFIVSDSGGSQGLGFAIPRALVSAGYCQLRKYGRFHRGVLGIQVQAITGMLAAGLGLSRTSGVVVCDVIPGTPAESAGVQLQDIVTSLNGAPIDNVPILALTLGTYGPGDTVTLDVIRGTRAQTLSIRMTDEPREIDPLEAAVADPQASAITKLGILGIDVAGSTSGMPPLRIASGVYVVARDQRSLGRDVPLRTGDVIHAVDGFAVSSVDGLRRLLDGIRADSPIVMQVERDGRLRFVTLQVL